MIRNRIVLAGHTIDMERDICEVWVGPSDLLIDPPYTYLDEVRPRGRVVVGTRFTIDGRLATEAEVNAMIERHRRVKEEE